MKAGKEIVPEEIHRIKAEDIYTPKANGGQQLSANGFGSKGGLNDTSSNGTPSHSSVDEYGDDYNH